MKAETGSALHLLGSTGDKGRLVCVIPHHSMEAGLRTDTDAGLAPQRSSFMSDTYLPHEP